MKKVWLQKSMVFLFLAVILSFMACEKEDTISDGTGPEFSELATHISTAPGREIHFTGTLSDNKGIASINLKYASWYLDKTIRFDSTRKSYHLDYKFLVPEDAEDKAHQVQITVTDLGDNQNSKQVEVTMDLDVTFPEITVSSPASGTSFYRGDQMNLDVSFSDNRGLDSVWVLVPSLNVTHEQALSSKPADHSYTQSVTIPDDMEYGTYPLTIKAADTTGNITTKEMTFQVAEKGQIDVVYAVGGATWYDWNVERATPMEQDPDNPDWFELTTYSGGGEDGIKFVGQLGWAPNNWGLVDNSDPSQGMINSDNSQKILLPEQGYYKVRFNPYDLEYSVEKVTPDIDTRSNMYLMGKGFVGYDLNWSPADAIPMTQSSENPYVFTKEIEFSDDVDLKFIGQTDGWSPYDCGFVEGGQVEAPVLHRNLVVGGGTADLKFDNQAGTYLIKMDYYLLRASVTQVQQ